MCPLNVNLPCDKSQYGTVVWLNIVVSFNAWLRINNIVKTLERGGDIGSV